jgi:DNA-binding MarR family transcriptional regulator
MPMALRDEIKQTKPFASLHEEAFLNVARTAAVLSHSFAEAMKAHGITATQYNVLRILRGAGNAGLTRNEVRDRLVAQVPDVTRLLDRMAEAGLVERERETVDRRMVTTRITAEGLRLLRALDAPVLELHRSQLGHLSRQQLATLVELLTLARGAG